MSFINLDISERVKSKLDNVLNMKVYDIDDNLLYVRNTNELFDYIMNKLNVSEQDELVVMINDNSDTLGVRIDEYKDIVELDKGSLDLVLRRLYAFLENTREHLGEYDTEEIWSSIGVRNRVIIVTEA